MTDEPTLEPVDFDEALDDWIAGASLARASVVVYGNGAVAARMHAIVRELAEAGYEPGSVEGEDTLVDTDDRLRALEAEWERLNAEREASRTEWVVEDVSAALDEIRALVGPLPEPPDPLEEPVLPSNPSEAQRRAHEKAVAAYEAARPAYEEALREYEAASMKWMDTFALRLIERAVVEIRFANGKKAPGISFEKLSELRQRIGERQLLDVKNAIDRLMKGEMVVEAPFSRNVSRPGRT